MRPKQHDPNERGVALIITLCVLALLLILAMSFAYSARTERIATGVNADVLSARLLAESGVERAIAFLREQTQYKNNPYPGASFFVPNASESGPDWVRRSGRYLVSVLPSASAITASVDGGQSPVVDALSSTIRRPGANTVHFTGGDTLLSQSAPGWTNSWIPVTVDHGTGTDSCIGLVAYLVIDETGKLDPNATVGAIYGTNSENTTDPDTRLGLDMREIAMADCYQDVAPGSFGNVEGTNFLLLWPSPGRWFGMYDMSARLNPGNQLWLDRYIWSLFTDSTDDPESYRTAMDSATAYHRCDIDSPVVVDWNTRDVASFPLGQVPDTSPPAGAGIPWVASMQSDPSDPNAAAIHNQIVANIIDFLDGDVGTVPLRPDTANDYTPGASGLGTATYVGLEQVPYINEVLVRVNYRNRTPVRIGPILLGYDRTVDVDGKVELVNIHGTDLTVPNLELQVTVTFDYIPAPLTQTLNYAWTNITVQAHDYAVAPMGNAYASGSFTIFFPIGSPPNDDDFTGFSVTDVRVVASRGSPATAADLWDCAHIEAQPAPIVLQRPGGPQVSSAQVCDPRCNTSGTGAGANWEWSSFGSGNETPGGLNTPNSDPSAAGADRDAEVVTDPKDLSTAFICNGPVTSFWQLGAIHRGEAWRTVNLHSADLTATRGVYAYGDWELLNQVQIKPPGIALSTRGRINAWSKVGPAWKPVLQGIRMGCPYLYPAGIDPSSGAPIAGTTPLSTDATVTALAAAVVSSMPSPPALPLPPGKAYMGRATLVTLNPPSLTDSTCGHGVTQNTDALQEELIGKVVGLLTDRLTYYTVLVCAKTVQDVGGLPPSLPSAPGDWVQYQAAPARYCRVLAEQKVLARVRRDVAGNRFWISQFEYLGGDE